MGDMHEVDYEIFGSDMQFVEIELDPDEAAVAEAGMMMYMQGGIEMKTIMGDGANEGFISKLFGIGRRLLTSESLFMTVFYNDDSSGKRRVSFAAPYPGKIVPIHLEKIGGTLICQRDVFIAGAKGVSIGLHLKKRIGAGFFGGEGFILQKLEGDGWAFVHAGGTIRELELAEGEELRVDTGCIVGYTPSVSFDVKFVGGIKSMLFGGEGVFLSRLRGPGHVWLQSLPFSRLADRIIECSDKFGDKKRGETGSGEEL
ncbi:MAG: TIGR00266 family protein [Verrucomicrobiales bacterium]|nr:TIGR00266 family protein [Verrucomicrobiales bacterium]|tara:strand:- start:3051 stop:3821 length:771 start_codon:yes stop_codon:yes gene_type:complete